jgi:hypothetical protein
MRYKLKISLKFNKKEICLKVKFKLINNFLFQKNLAAHLDGVVYVRAIVYVIMIVVHVNVVNVAPAVPVPAAVVNG